MTIVEHRSGRAIDGTKVLVVATAASAVALAVGAACARRFTGPITRLRKAADQLALGELDARVDDTAGPSDVRALARSFNSMAQRLGRLVTRQQAFAGMASHQLRAPLTALRLRLEQLSLQLEDDHEATETVEAALFETDRLQHLIESLLALSRAEEAALGPVEVDLSAVVRERAEHWAPLADERSVALVADVPDGVVVSAVPGAVGQIVDNLVDNAVEVSPPGSTLRLEVAVGTPLVELHVIDEGPGLSAEDRQRAFERFWRGPGSAPGGSGLGLAIVQQLVAAGEGTAELRAAPSGGIDAVVRFRSGADP